MLNPNNVKITQIGDVIEIIAPLPESVNKMYSGAGGKRGKLRKSDSAKAYTHLLGYALNLSTVSAFSGFVDVRITFLFKTLKSDIDNPVKLFLDSLQHHIYNNDSQVVNLTVEKRLADSPKNACVIAEISASGLTRDDLVWGA